LYFPQKKQKENHEKSIFTCGNTAYALMFPYFYTIYIRPFLILDVVYIFLGSLKVATFIQEARQIRGSTM